MTMRVHRGATKNPKIQQLPKWEDTGRSEFGTVGMGKPWGARAAMNQLKNMNRDSEGFGAALSPLVEDLRGRADCPLLTMPTIIEVNWLLGGPQTDDNIDVSFGAEIDPFHSGKSPNISGEVQTNLAMPGETQTYMIICGIGWHLEPEPESLDIMGNALTPVPTVGITQPQSPDVMSFADGAGSVSLPLPEGSSLLPAWLRWGSWANYAAWLMAQAYNLRWMVGTNCNILLDPLRNTAYMPPAAQTGSASDSVLEVADLVRRTNTFYRDFLGTSAIFLKTDAIRIGSDATGSDFRLSRDREFVEATFGGIGLSGLLQGNTEFRPLSMPHIIKAGVPVGLKIEESDTRAANLMRSYIAATFNGAPDFGAGAVPPAFTDDLNIVAGATLGINERGLDGVDRSITQFSQRVAFKGGQFNIKVKLKGFEITEDLYNIMANNSDIRDAVCADCGIRFTQQGA
jgi:hypothetical protein